MAMTEAFIAEMDQESEATRRMLEVVPADRLDWKPHEKSMSLGQLAIHVATIPGGVARAPRYRARRKRSWRRWTRASGRPGTSWAAWTTRR